MTFAICTACGARKFGALKRCQDCGHEPSTPDDQVYSVAYSDHYYDDAGLRRIAEAIRRGERPAIPAKLGAELRQSINKFDHLLPKHQSKAQAPHQPELPFNPSMPDITSVRPSRSYRVGEDFALLLRNPRTIGESAGMHAAIRYPYVLAVVAHSSWFLTHAPDVESSS